MGIVVVVLVQEHVLAQLMPFIIVQIATRSVHHHVRMVARNHVQAAAKQDAILPVRELVMEYAKIHVIMIVKVDVRVIAKEDVLVNVAVRVGGHVLVLVKEDVQETAEPVVGALCS